MKVDEKMYKIPWYKKEGQALSEIFPIEWNEKTFERVFLNNKRISYMLNDGRLYIGEYPTQSPIIMQDIIRTDPTSILAKVKSMEYDGLTVEFVDDVMTNYLIGLAESDILHATGLYAVNRSLDTIDLLNIYFCAIDMDNNFRFI